MARQVAGEGYFGSLIREKEKSMADSTNETMFKVKPDLP